MNSSDNNAFEILAKDIATKTIVIAEQNAYIASLERQISELKTTSKGDDSK